MTGRQDAFSMVAQQLRQAVEALEAGKGDGGGAPLSSSLAARENQDTSLRGAWGDTPAHDANNLARLLCISASDHLLAMADMVESPNAGVFACYTLGRGVLEAAARAWYLTEPHVDIRERVRRGMNERLWNINESRRFLQGIGADTAAIDAHETATVDAARARGLDPSTKRSGLQLGAERLSPMALCGLILRSPASGTEFGEATYRFFSSPAHGSESGLAGHLINLDNGARMAPGKNSEILARYLIWPLKAYLQMGDRFLDHYGWDKTLWVPARDNALSIWVGHATQATLGGQPFVS